MAHGRATNWKDLPMALKTTLCFLSLTSLVLIAAWLATSSSGGSSADYVFSSLIAALPKWGSNWLAPPYLFLTVHFIILLIWKLSEHKPHPHPPPKHNLSVPAPPPAPAPAVAAQQDYYHQWHPQQQHEQQQQQEHHHPDLSHDDASCTTEDESDRNSTASSSPLLIRRNERPPLPAAVLHKQLIPPTPPPPEQSAPFKEEEKEEQEGGGGIIEDMDDSMDATWRAIMANTSRPLATDQAIEAEMSAAGAGADEMMNQRFEEFIRKSRDQIMAMAN